MMQREADKLPQVLTEVAGSGVRRTGSQDLLEPTVVVLDGLGEEQPREVSINEVKSRFFVLGLQSGVALQQLVLSVVIVVASRDAHSSVEELSGLYYPLFRGIFLFAWFGCMYGVLLFLWKRAGIDYASLLGVPAGRHNYHVVIRASFTLVSVNFACFVLFFLTLAMGVTPNKHIWPAAALLCTLLFLAWPVDTMPKWHDASQRAALGRTVLRVLASPFSEATFAHSFVADVFTSMPKCFNDIAYVSCIYLTGEWWQLGDWDARGGAWTGGVHHRLHKCTSQNPAYRIASIGLSLLPFWIRLMQCVRAYRDTRVRRHIANGLKYSCSISVVAISSFDHDAHSPAWLVMSCISTLVAALWDVLVDWGLGPPSLRGWIHGQVGTAGSDHGLGSFRKVGWTRQQQTEQRDKSAHCAGEFSWLLRPVRVFPDWVYYAVVTSNTLCRLGWAVYISRGDAVNAQHLILVLAAVELFRRAQWALLRVEWEQISNIWKAAEAEHRVATAVHEERRMSRAASINNLESLGVSLLEANSLEEPPISPTRATVAERIERNRLRMQRNSIEQYDGSES